MRRPALPRTQITQQIQLVERDRGSQTPRWREVDSDFRFVDALEARTVRPWSSRLIRR